MVPKNLFQERSFADGRQFSFLSRRKQDKMDCILLNQPLPEFVRSFRVEELL
jgi:hypothetical protein